MECEIHQVRSAIWKCSDKVFQLYQRLQFERFRIKATGHQSTSANTHTPMKTAGVEDNSGAANITAHQRMEFHVHVSNSDTKATTWSITDMDHIVSQQEKEIYCITSNMQLQCKKEFCICLNVFEV